MESPVHGGHVFGRPVCHGVLTAGALTSGEAAGELTAREPRGERLGRRFTDPARLLSE